MKEAALKESCQQLINQIIEDVHTSPQNSDKGKFLTYDVKDSSIIWNLMKGGYSFSFNQYEFIIENLQMLKTIASNLMWEKYHKKNDSGYTWGQHYKQHFRGDTQMIKPFPDERPRNQNRVNRLTGDEMYDSIPLAKSVVKKGSRKYLGKAKNSAPIFQWYKHKSNNSECNYCGIMLTEYNRSRDHVIPIKQGGKHNDNLVWCCKQCNELKSGYTLEEWLVLLKQKLPSLHGNNELLTYYSRIIEAVTYMIKMRDDHDLINDPENVKAASLDKHLYSAINKKKRKKAQY